MIKNNDLFNCFVGDLDVYEHFIQYGYEEKKIINCI